VVLSLFLPGLGELYAGRPEVGLVSFVIFYALLAVNIALFYMSPIIALFIAPLIAILAWVIVLVRAGRTAARAPQPFLLRAYNRWYWYAAIILASAFFWQGAVKNEIKRHWLDAYKIPSDAMEPTMLSGDFVLASKRLLGKVPRENEVVVHEFPTRPDLVNIKRVVGLPGDTLAMRDGVLMRNGIAVAEPFIQLIDPAASAREDLGSGVVWQVRHLVTPPARETEYRPDMRNWGPLVVPRDSVFVLGDNRDRSADSRFWGALGLNQLRGRPLVIYFSRDRHSGGVRWSRIGRRF